MKPSIYNYYITTDSGAVIFNGITERFFHVSMKTFESFKAIINNPDSYADKCSNFIKEMCSNGFIVAYTADEWQNLTEKYQNMRMNSTYRLMVLPTYECNLNCWYCTQSHEKILMSKNLTERIKKNIHTAVESKQYSRLMLDWFGGEPLLAYDILLDLTLYAANLCKEYGLQFTSHITTNGTLLNEHRIKQLYDAGIRSYQITIDGTKEMHDTVKRLNGESAFETTLQSICKIAEHTHCIIRFNYTHKNLMPDAIISQLAERIPEGLRKNVSFSMHRVWQENSMLINKQDVDRLFSLAKNQHFNPSRSVYNMCYADQANFFCIFPNGKVGKCDNSNPNDVPGRILEDGSIEWPKGMGYDIPVAEQEDSECKSCRYLPICWGPCVPKRKSMLRTEGRIRCYISDKEDAMQENILKRISLYSSQISGQV